MCAPGAGAGAWPRSQIAERMRALPCPSLLPPCPGAAVGSLTLRSCAACPSVLPVCHTAPRPHRPLTRRYEIAALRSPFYSTALNFYTLGNKITKAEYERPPPHFSKTVRATSMITTHLHAPLDATAFVAAPVCVCIGAGRALIHLADSNSVRVHVRVRAFVPSLCLPPSAARTDFVDDPALARRASRHRAGTVRGAAGVRQHRARRNRIGRHSGRTGTTSQCSHDRPATATAEPAGNYERLKADAHTWMHINRTLAALAFALALPSPIDCFSFILCSLPPITSRSALQSTFSI